MRLLPVKRFRNLALAFLVPGLLGMFTSAALSTRYLNTLPHRPDMAALRIIPRGIHGTVVYQTRQEDRALTAFEVSSSAACLIGLGLGLVYAWKSALPGAFRSSE